MATQVQFRRGNTANMSAFTGAVGEITVDTDKKIIVVHDGSTVGGTPGVSAVTLSSNLANYQTTADLSANVATLTANNTSFVGSISAANVVSNAQLSSNLANYVTTTGLSNNLANYQTTADLSANVATLTANNANFLGGIAAASYTNTSGAYTISGVHTHTANLAANSYLISNGPAYGAVGTLTDAANISMNLASYNNWTLTLNGARNLDNPTNLTVGQSGVIWVSQNTTGGQTLSYGSFWKFPANTAPTLTTTASAVDLIVYTVKTSTNITAQCITNIG